MLVPFKYIATQFPVASMIDHTMKQASRVVLTSTRFWIQRLSTGPDTTNTKMLIPVAINKVVASDLFKVDWINFKSFLDNACAYAGHADELAMLRGSDISWNSRWAMTKPPTAVASS